MVESWEGSHEARESPLFAPSDVPWDAITSQILGISPKKPILHEAGVPLLVMPGLPRKQQHGPPIARLPFSQPPSLFFLPSRD